jgi:hypothetical protein
MFEMLRVKLGKVGLLNVDDEFGFVYFVNTIAWGLARQIFTEPGLRISIAHCFGSMAMYCIDHIPIPRLNGNVLLIYRSHTYHHIHVYL